MAGAAESFWATIPGLLTALAGVVTAVGSLVATLYKAGVVGKRRRVAAAGAPGTEAGDGASRVVEAAPRPGPAPGSPIVQLRSVPAILSSAKIDALLVRLDYFEKSRNPAGKGLAHDYRARAIGDAVVVEDHATGLMWQKVASADAMELKRTTAYIDELNATRYAGFADWRLPTIEEAMSLMDTQPTDSSHITPVFARGGYFIWTADRHADGGGWVVYYYDALLRHEPEGFNAWVRAVR